MALIAPDDDHFDEYTAIIAEFTQAQSWLDGSGFSPDAYPQTTPPAYTAWVERLRAEGDVHREPAPGRVHCTYFWITDTEDRWVGFVALRHQLNDFLLEQGGHIGYSVRPSRRREGWARHGLQSAVAHARDSLGLQRVLVTCDLDNVASARTIESCGGVLEDTRVNKRRYWIAT